MNDLRSRPRTKDSGVECLEETPAHWEVERIKNVVSTHLSNVDKHSKEGEHPVRLCNYSNVYHNDHIHCDLDFMEATATTEEIERFRLATDDVLITKDSEAWDDIGVPSLVRDTKDNLICGYHLALLRPNNGKVLGHHLYWILSCREVASQFHVRANGVTRFGLSHDAVTSIRIPMPPVAEQASLAHFLDRATRRIDRYISTKEKLIALLDEQQRAVIHEAATGQIDVRTGQPYPAYRESGVEWLDEVPSHWSSRRLGTVAKVFNGSTPSRSQPAYWVGGTIPWLNSSKVNDGVVLKPSDYVTDRALQECSIAVVPCGAVIVGLVGQGRTRGLAALLGIDTTISQNLAAIVPTDPLDGRYLRYLLSTQYEHLRDLGRGGNQEALNCDLVGRLRVHMPSTVEQAAIVEHLDRCLTNVRAARTRVNRQIAVVKEYRTRLIEDVVTGKLDVRDVAHLPNKPDDPGILDCDHALAAARKDRPSPSNRTYHQ